MKNGYLDWNAVAVVDYAGSKYYVSGGMIDWNFIGKVTLDGTTYSVTNGVALIMP